ncbi:MAG TPA: FecR family protein [Polyangiaceae bacterium]|nr:FecR family protein [Polyangiaceae bacterium]
MTEPRRPSRFAQSSQEPRRLHLRDDLEESQVKEMWQRIDHAPARPRRPWLVAWVAAAMAVLLLTFGVLRSSREPETRQLALLSGATPGVLSADAGPVETRFDDGSAVSLAALTRLEVLRNDARSFVTALRRGGATFDVKPGGPRHWIIEAGELSVEVVGTRFRVERQGELTRVSVEHGIVVVRGERVPSGSVRLTAGTSFELPVASTVAADEGSSARAEAAPTVPNVAPSASDSPRAAAAPPSSASSGAEPPPRDEVERALLAADSARRQGDNAAAIGYFNAAWQQAAAGDARRGLAALSLARLLMGGQPAKAAQILRSSLSDMPQALLEDASVRLVEAESRSGNPEAAARAADEYSRRFPAGRRAEEVRRWSKP